MSVAKLHRRVNDTAEALCDLVDRAYEAASHLRDRERADFADGYDQSATLSAQHAAELEDCLARLNEERPPCDHEFQESDVRGAPWRDATCVHCGVSAEIG